MDIHHNNRGIICNERRTVIQSRFDVHELSLNRNSQIVVKLVQITPLRPRFNDFVDFATTGSVFKHQPGNFLQ